jgi:hypothetical protein
MDISVRVVSEGALAAILDRRPVRVLPDGASGVVFRGEVFPLHPGDEIHLDDPTYDKDACPTSRTDKIVYCTRQSRSADEHSRRSRRVDPAREVPPETLEAIHTEVQALLAKYSGPMPPRSGNRGKGGWSSYWPTIRADDQDLDNYEDDGELNRKRSSVTSGEVWITQAGECFHTDDDCVLLRRGRAKGYEETGHSTRLESVSLGEAMGLGRRACRNCG